MKKLIIYLLYKVKFDIFTRLLCSLIGQVKAERYGRVSKQKINFIPQGGFDFEIAGPLANFTIHETSHLKSNAYIECSGGVIIGRHFHCGRGLTIFSSNHNWRAKEYLPYDSTSVLKPVTIGDAVWVGSNVTILPGICIDDAAIIAAGSVVVKDVGVGELVGGNPAKLIFTRNLELTKKLLSENKFF